MAVLKNNFAHKPGTRNDTTERQ